MKTPDRRQAMSGAGEQLHLIPPPQFCPTWPKRASLAGRALSTLLKGQAITHPEFEIATGSWRLAEPIRALCHDHGWPVETVEIRAPTAENPNRKIARYVLPDSVRQQIGAVR